MLPRPSPRSTSFRLGRALAAAALLALLPAASPTAGASDPKALEIAAALVEKLGGERAWEAARFFRFSFAGARTHYWDKWDGRHRLELTTADGERVVVLHNVQTREGRAWKDGEPLAGAEADQALEQAYGAWVNDTYWLLMPFKLRDPGVTLTYAGEEDLGGTLYDKLMLTFDGVGLTPGDRYWAYVDRETGMMDRWAYVLESFEEDRPPTHWLWLEWQRHGGLLLSSRRQNLDSGRELHLDGIEVPESMPDSVFTSPEPLR